MADLPGNLNWLQKLGNGLKNVVGKVAMAATPGAIPAQIHTEGNIYIQERREALQIEQMKLSWVQHRENLELRESVEKDRQAGIERLAALNHERNLEIQKRNQEHQKELEQYRAMVQVAIQEKNIDFQKWKLQEEKELQLKIINLRHQLDFEIAKYNRETALNTVREQRRLANSPITLVSDDLLESPYRNGNMPLRILLSPPELNSDSFVQKSLGFKIENHLAEELREFLQQNYSFNGEQRQTQLLDGAWVSKKFRGGAGIQALHSQLKAVPTIVLESETDNNYLTFRVAYWRGDGSEPKYGSILSNFPYRDFLYESARDRARKWQQTKQELLAMGETPDSIKAVGGDNEFNWFVLQKEQKLLDGGIDIAELDLQKQYKLNERDFQKLHQILIVFHCIVASAIADIHYLAEDIHLTPLLPSLLPELLEDIPNNHDLQKTMLDWLIVSYNVVYQKLEEVMAGWIPEFLMQFATALSHLEDKTYAKQQGEESVKAWLRVRGIENYTRKVLREIVTKDDEPYFESLQEFIKNIEDSESLTLIKQLLEDWQLLNEFDVVPNSLQIDNIAIEEIAKKKLGSIGKEFSFEVVTVNSSGNIIGRETKTNRQQDFDLGDGVKLEMVYIPEGSFTMGSPEGEGNDREKPQHEVNISPFLMGKYPITQAQWRAIALHTDLKAERDLDSDPARFIGDRLPIERVNWYDAVEFCARLSKLTGKEYRLPSEAEWEYACRAGTTTPFYFGETISTDLANYDGNYTYGNGTKGEYREQTTPVGNFPPNAFGLYDMHGNVYEWCADAWHDNYEGAPTDGSAWLKNGNDNRSPLRGGSWNNFPNYCRSAFRLNNIRAGRDNFNYNIGFRVVCGVGRTT